MNISNLKIGHRLNGSFALSALLLAVVVAIGASQLNRLGGEIDLAVNDAYGQLSALQHTRNGLEAQARELSNAVLAGDAVRAAAANGGAGEPDFGELGARLDDPEALALLRTAADGQARLGAGRAKVAGLLRSGQKDQAAAALLSDVGPAQAASLAAIDKLAAFHEQRMRDSAVRARAGARRSATVMIVLGVAGAALSMLTGWLITGGIVRPIRHAVKVARTVASGDLGSAIEVRSSDEIGQLSQALKDMHDSLVRIVTEVRGGTDAISHASAEIADGNQDLSARTEQQAGSLEETASSMEQLTGTVRQNADNARQANLLALSASAVADKGGAVVNQVMQTMDAIDAASRKIVDIISVIDGIAFQTNILALNAAVEAARAGEQGRGFAVVAGEVRNLAQRSASAAREIKQLIGDSVSQVGSGARLAGEAGRTMSEIVHSVRRVTDIMAEITAASHDQLAGIEQVNAAIVQMDEVTQQNAALVEEAAATAGAMRQQAAQLSAAVGLFQLGEAHGRAAGAPQSQRPRALRPAQQPRPEPAFVARAAHLDRPKRIVTFGSSNLHGFQPATAEQELG